MQHVTILPIPSLSLVLGGSASLVTVAHRRELLYLVGPAVWSLEALEPAFFFAESSLVVPSPPPCLQSCRETMYRSCHYADPAGLGLLSDSNSKILHSEVNDTREQ